MSLVVNPYYNFYLLDGSKLLVHDYRDPTQSNIHEGIFIPLLLKIISCGNNQGVIDESIKSNPQILDWLLDIENNEMVYRTPKISCHPGFQIISQSDICHECIIRWLPRTDNLDSYIQEFNRGTKKFVKCADALGDALNGINHLSKMLNENKFLITDDNGEYISSSWIPLIHPECKSDHKSKSTLNILNEMNNEDVFHRIYEVEKDIFNNYHFVSVFNAPSNIKINKQAIGWGMAKMRSLARTKAIMESLERFHLLLPSKDQKILTSGKELGDKTVDLTSAFSFSSYQYERSEFKNYKLTDIKTWVKAKNISFPKREYIPLEYVELRENLPKKSKLLYTDSTGTAAHFEEEFCIQSGFLEVIERAGQYKFWVDRDCIKVDGDKIINIKVRNYLDTLKKLDIKVDLWATEVITGIYTFICSLSFKSVGEHMVFGSASHFNMYKGMIKAIEEAYGQLTYGKSLINEGSFYQHSIDFDSPIDHLKFYLNPENKKHLSNFFHMQSLNLLNPMELNFKKILDIARGNNWDVMIVDRNSTLTQVLGAKVYQIIIPQLPSLGFNLNELRLPHIKEDTPLFNFLSNTPHPFS
ncbi:YcaO-like family protein [Priestia flexa]|uniref:YcaO-like family protein n=1 Tax=Priestia flexa TaxID=86664 RepID=UPI000C240ECE|nr:YcaO-like family protein [Priestia flexa]MEC0665827.1 YcaO-like family protein [Priestia flexa]